MHAPVIESPLSDFSFVVYCQSMFQVHGVFHSPDQAAIIVDDLILQMKREIEANPMMPVGENILN